MGREESIFLPSYIQDRKHTNLLVSAPPRSGKTSTLIRNMLTYKGSCICTDLKGAEIFFTTARRRAEMGQTVSRFDPFHTAEETFFQLLGLEAEQKIIARTFFLGSAEVAATDAVWHTLLNPQQRKRLETLRPALHSLCRFPPKRLNPLTLAETHHPAFLETIDTFCEAIVIPQNSSQPYFQEKAKSLLKTALLFVCLYAPPEKRNLGEIHRFFQAFARRDQAWLNYFEILTGSELWDGLLAHRSREFITMNETEIRSVEASLNLELEWLGNPYVRHSLEDSDQNFDELKKKTTLYLILPAETTRASARLIRLLFSSIALSFFRQPGQGEPLSVFFLDEFPVLGNLGSRITDLLAVLPGYGLRTLLLCQTLAQLRAAYGKDYETLLGLCQTKVFLHPSEKGDTEYISQLLGKQWKIPPTQRLRDPIVGSYSAANSQVQQLERMKPEEIRQQDNQIFVFAPGQAPRIGKRLDYLKDSRCRSFADPNPHYPPSARPAFLKGLF